MPWGTSPALPMEKIAPKHSCNQGEGESGGFIWTLSQTGCLKFKVSVTSVKLFPSVRPSAWRAACAMEGWTRAFTEQPKGGVSAHRIHRVIQTSGDRPPKRHPEKLAGLHRAPQTSCGPRMQK